jgi:hypothetical protein
MKPLRQLALAGLFILITAPTAPAQEVFGLREQFPSGYVYDVSSRVDLSGSVTLPAEKGKAPRTLAITGKSALDYQERILALAADGQVHKTIRLYRRMDFERKVGPQQEQTALRPAVRRLVILRHKQAEVPFSPDGPLTWNEIDLVRTDVFTPALSGLLPARPVRLGERWNASTEAVLELTDMSRLDSGGLTCELKEISSVSGRRLARVAFRGTVRGPGEDGPTQHELDGYLFFDLTSQHISYLWLRGRQNLLDEAGKVAGKIEGSMVLTRRPVPPAPELADAALRGLNLEPNADNTRLLYENSTLGVRFLYPRRWHVAGVRGRQLVADDGRGNGLLLTIEPPARLPTAAGFLQESRTYLEKQKAKIIRIQTPHLVQRTPTTVEQFSLEMEMAGQRAWLDYYVVRDAVGGATVAARLLPADAAVVSPEVRRIVESLRVVRKQ